MRKLSSFTCLLSLLMLSNATFAADVTANVGSNTETTMQVELTVNAGCDIASTSQNSTLNLGSIVDLGQAQSTGELNSSGAKLEVNCTANSSPTISFDNGSNYGKAADATTDRALTDGTHYIPYRLYSDKTDKNMIKSDTPIPMATQQNAPGEQSITVYPELPQSTAAYPGKYTDTVHVTVSWTGSSKLAA